MTITNLTAYNLQLARSQCKSSFTMTRGGLTMHQVSAAVLPDMSGTDTPNPERWEAWWAMAKIEPSSTYMSQGTSAPVLSTTEEYDVRSVVAVVTYSVIRVLGAGGGRWLDIKRLFSTSYVHGMTGYKNCRANTPIPCKSYTTLANDILFKMQKEPIYRTKIMIKEDGATWKLVE